jgi:hypothetical protein
MRVKKQAKLGRALTQVLFEFGAAEGGIGHEEILLRQFELGSVSQGSDPHGEFDVNLFAVTAGHHTGLV